MPCKTGGILAGRSRVKNNKGRVPVSTRRKKISEHASKSKLSSFAKMEVLSLFSNLHIWPPGCMYSIRAVEQDRVDPELLMACTDMCRKALNISLRCLHLINDFNNSLEN